MTNTPDLRERIIAQVLAWGNAKQPHYAEYLLKRMTATVPWLNLPTWAGIKKDDK